MGCHVSTGKALEYKNQALVYLHSNFVRTLKMQNGHIQEERKGDPIILQSPNDKNTYKPLVLSNGLRVLLIRTYEKDNENRGLSVTKEIADGGSNTENNRPKLSRRCSSVADATKAIVMKEKETAKKYTFADVAREVMKQRKESIQKIEKSFSKETKMAGAALCIGVGSFHDPEELPGLAHFLEHMVYMGSQKYPDENHYKSFISKHGGDDNAFTSDERTVFYMGITPDHLKEGLDIFANFFISPLLNTDSMKRERKAVNSEFELSAASDALRATLVFRSLAKPGHPMSKFQCGNEISLKEEPEKLNINVNDALRQFQQRYYSANRMTLALQSIETLETLENWVTEVFSALPNNGLPVPTFDQFKQPYEFETFHKIYKVLPVNEAHNLYISWALPPLVKEYKSRPLSYLGHLVGHEGKGSILSLLKKRNWALYLNAGAYDMNSAMSLYSVVITLTESGMDNIYEVITLVLQYIEMLRKNGPQERFFKELDIVAKTFFRFQEKEDPVGNVTELAQNMQLYDMKHYLVGDRLYFQYDPKMITDMLELMTPSRLNIGIISPRNTDDDCKEVEKWTKCKYGFSDIPDEWETNWKDMGKNSEFHLPEENKFLATDLELKHQKDENKYPIKIFEDEVSRVWLKEDAKFKSPKAFIEYNFFTREATTTLPRYIMGALLNMILDYNLNEEMYPATLAGMGYCVASSLKGLVFIINGFNHKLAVLLEIVIDHILNFDADEDIFQNIKTLLRESCSNSTLYPGSLAMDLQSTILKEKFWTDVETQEALESIDLSMVKNYAHDLRESIFYESFYHGNLWTEEALAMDRMVREKMHPLPLSEEHYLKYRLTELPIGTSICRAVGMGKEDQNSVIINHYQFGPRNLKFSCNLSLLSSIMEEPCFNTLRTKEQLGYIVRCNNFEIWGSFSLEIEVHCPSNKFSCVYIESRIEEFLKNFLKDIQEMDKEKFETHRDSLVHLKKCDDYCLAEENGRFWTEIANQRYVFDRLEQEILHLENLQLEDFKVWLNEEMDLLTSAKRKLSIQVLGPSDEILLELKGTASLKEEATEDEDENQPTSEDEKQAKLEIKLLDGSSENESESFITDIKAFKESLPFYDESNVDP